MRKLIELFIKKLKKDPNYKLDINYDLRELFSISYIRIKQIIRGIHIKILASQSKGIIFCGKGVKIEYGFLIQTGSSLILEDNVRLIALSEKGIRLGNNVTIAKNSILQCTGVIANKGVGIEIGSNSAVGANSYLGGQGGIIIGNDVIMGPGVMIFSENHSYSRVDLPIRKQDVIRKGVFIHDNCWIGAGSIILDGVEIGEGCVVSAGAVVTKSVPKDTVVAGIPARILKKRN